MPTHSIRIRSGAVSMSSRTADKLIAQGDGDAALLYLYLLRTGGLYDPAQAARTLHWEPQRVVDSFTALEQLTLVEGPEAEDPVTDAPAPEQAPDYSIDEVSRELERDDSSFRGLLAAVESKLGKKLPMHSLKLLLELYDYLGLPPEVILLLVNHMVAEEERKRGPGRRPTMAQIRTVGYRWAQKGIDSAEAVTAYLKKLDYFHSREGEVLAVLGIRSRPAVAAERKYIESWLDWGFDPPAISAAYERTVLKTGQMNWPYCNSILKSWHKKGLHTPAEIAAENRPAPKASVPGGNYKGPGAPILPQKEEKTAEDVAWMKEFLARQSK